MKEKSLWGGVPEHFNFPILKGIEKGILPIEWLNTPEGTGAMAEKLENDELDYAIMLTEGAISNIHKGKKFKIAGFHIQSPLLWGVHKGKNELKKDQPIEFAISRYTSGSHLMAYLYAKQTNLNLNKIKFKVINNLKGALDYIPTSTNSLFLWEHFTTKPYVEQGMLERVDDIPTPWPCFVICCKPDKYNENLMDKIYNANISFGHPNYKEEIASNYNLKIEDINEWHKNTQWEVDQSIDPTILDHTQDTLLELGIIEKKLTFEELTI